MRFIVKKSHISCTVVIPAYNEGATIYNVSKKLIEQGLKVIVVDDGSYDNTSKEALRAGATVIRNTRNQGYSKSANTGINAAKEHAEYIALIDGDGEHNPDDIKNMLSCLHNGYDAAFGLRKNIPRISEKIFSLYSLKNTGIPDPLCGFRIFKKGVIDQIGVYDSLDSYGADFIFNAYRSGFSLKKVKISNEKRRENPRIGGILKSNMKILSAMLRTIAKHGLFLKQKYK